MQDNNEGHSINGNELKSFFVTLFKEVLDLEDGIDKWTTIETIKSKQSMSGANAWMLMCSIVIASIGLNLDSQAVIIGAMLISPLMSPILGIGLGVAINDKDALYHALLHFGAAILIALFFSTIYFWLIPLDEFTEQIKARTEPTFLDILVGIFGGVAGILSYARKDVSTTIPGVAIATALMPPLCVTGYGIANGNWDIITKSFYLFFLNSFFVALATFLILRYLKFPITQFESKAERTKNAWRVLIFAIVMIIPSILIFSNIYKEYVVEQKTKEFIAQYIGEDDIFLDSYTMKSHSDGSRILYLKVYGETINDSKVPVYQNALDSLGLDRVSIEIIPTSEIPLQKIKQIETEISEVGGQLNSLIDQVKIENEARQKIIESYNQDPMVLTRDSVVFGKAIEEIKIFMPEITKIGLAQVPFCEGTDNYIQMPTAIVFSAPITKEKKSRLESYFKSKFELDTLKIIYSQ